MSYLDLLSVLAFILGFMEERVICIYGFHGNMIYRWSAEVRLLSFFSLIDNFLLLVFMRVVRNVRGKVSGSI